jgi:hypothetical protein
MAELQASIEVTSSRFTDARRVRIVVDSITAVGDEANGRGFITTAGGQHFTVMESYDQILAKIAAA